ncbi:MAG TPA: DUF72 domain-containing protein [Hyphomicrobiaceae bacterium]|nr:DUF72 domain-containing protein [Hyphomicrobiaceae bacterium]
MPKSGAIRIGIGGWTFAPWRGVFYPDDLPQAKELFYASRRLTSIEINGTFYSTQSPATFAKWRSETPDGFVFTLKGPRYAVNRRVLAEAGESIDRFFRSGVAELGDRLGPVLWQFAPSKRFDPDDFGAFLALLPRSLEGRPLRHAVEVRHPSFATPEFVALLRRHSTALVYADHARYPAIADVTGDFVYARLQRGVDALPVAYPLEDLDAWARRARAWARGEVPGELPLADPEHRPAGRRQPRDVFMYVIHEGKLRAPAAALALIERL